MSCLSCVTAHRRGALWFCNRCGKPVLVQPVTAQGVSPRGRSPHPSERERVFVFRGNSAASVPLRLVDPDRETGSIRPEGPGRFQMEAGDAVVVDLDEARRLRQSRTF